MAKSVEEPVEDWAKKSLDGCGVKHFVENAADNSGMGVSTMRLLEGSVALDHGVQWQNSFQQF